MNKRSICIFNTILATILFLCIFGYVCYRGGVPGHLGGDFYNWIWVSVYYAILLILTIVSIHFTYFPQKYFIFVAIYSLLFVCMLLVEWIWGAIISEVPDNNRIWFVVLMSIFTPIISGMYFYGAFARRKK